MPTIQLSWPNRKAAIRAAVLAVVGLTAIHNAVFVPFFRLSRHRFFQGYGTRCDGSPSYVARAITDRLPRRCRHLDGLRVLAVGAPDPERCFIKEWSSGEWLIPPRFKPRSCSAPIESADKIRLLAERLRQFVIVPVLLGADNTMRYLDQRPCRGPRSGQNRDSQARSSKSRARNNAAEDVTKDWWTVMPGYTSAGERATVSPHSQSSLAPSTDTPRSYRKTQRNPWPVGATGSGIRHPLRRSVQPSLLAYDLRADARHSKVLGLRWRPLTGTLIARELVDSLRELRCHHVLRDLHLPVIPLWLF